MSTLPWHAAPLCACGGPLVPGDGDDPAAHENRVHFVRCAACGTRALLDPSKPDDLRTIVRAWWSAGAWVGHTEPRST